jgi:hypothetical protein
MDNILQIVDPDELYGCFDVDALWLVPRRPGYLERDGGSYRTSSGAFTFGGGYNQTDSLASGSVSALPFPDMRQHDRAGLADKARRLFGAGCSRWPTARGIYEISSSLRGPGTLFIDMVLDQYPWKLMRRVEEHRSPTTPCCSKRSDRGADGCSRQRLAARQAALLTRFFRRVYKPRLRRLAHPRLTALSPSIRTAPSATDSDFIEIGWIGSTRCLSAAGITED